MGGRRSRTDVLYYTILETSKETYLSVVVESSSGVLATRTAAGAEAVASPDYDAALGSLPS
jgi:hypothetical protein